MKLLYSDEVLAQHAVQEDDEKVYNKLNISCYLSIPNIPELIKTSIQEFCTYFKKILILYCYNSCMLNCHTVHEICQLQDFMKNIICWPNLFQKNHIFLLIQSSFKTVCIRNCWACT